MPFFQKRSGFAFLVLLALLAVFLRASDSEESRLPAFGRDTVLVWKIQSQGYSSNFVVRIAEFSPDRYVEWEDDKTQGTIFMPSRDIQSARGFVSAHLFEAGMDTRGKNTTTLWLSQKIYRDLKERKKIKIDIDGVRGSTVFQGNDQLIVEVNGAPMVLPVIRVSDDRGGERWFLDQGENPLMVKHSLRKFSQTLVSITTDRTNTLRWIKGKKLANPPH